MSTSRSVILSLTPLPFERDSRAVKIACSIKRLGYNSIGAENIESRNPGHSWNFERFALRPIRQTPQENNQGCRQLKPGFVRNLFKDAIHFLRFLVVYLIVRPLFGRLTLPASDVIYLHEYRLFPLAWCLTWGRSTKIIYDAHDYYPLAIADDNLTLFWRRIFQPFLGILESVCIKKSDIIVTVNQGIVDLYAHSHGVHAKVLRNSHDERLDNHEGPGIRSVLGLSDDDILLVSVGHYKTGLAVHPLLEALTELPDQVHVAFAGSGFAEIEDYAISLNLSERAHFLGPLDGTKIVPFIRDADAGMVLYYPITEDFRLTLPNKFFQTIAAGLPVLYPDLPELRRIADMHSLGVIFDHTDKGNVKQTIEDFASDPARRNSLIENSTKAWPALSWQNEEITLNGIIDQVLSNDQERPG